MNTSPSASPAAFPWAAAGRAQSTTASIPWQLTAVIFASSSVLLGLIWDISWHMSIGRDTFWTPAHLAIYTGGAVAGIACGFETLRRSFFVRPSPTDGVTIWRYFNGPLGGWLCIWGAVAMLTSGPFDDWWHNAYGLDVKIISPPHALLALGFMGILAGALVMAMSEQARALPHMPPHALSETASTGEGHAIPGNAATEVTTASPWIAWIVAYASSLVLCMLAIFSTEFFDRVVMHRGSFYIAAATVFPIALVAAGRSVRLRYPATAVALLYSAIMTVQLWVLPLFDATPKLGPIRQDVTHMVPLDFPLLLVVPALLIDLVLRRTDSLGAWRRAFVLGLVFVGAFAAVQWPFADFLMSDAARGPIFQTESFPYMLPLDSYATQHRFYTEPLLDTARGLAIAGVVAVLSARVGLKWGGWLRAVRR